MKDRRVSGYDPYMLKPRTLTLTVSFWILCSAIFAQGTPITSGTEKQVARTVDLFGKENLVAWCIVPFDAKNRSPVERAAMVRRLGLSRVAYDWRPQHVASFEEEIVQYKKHDIDFFAFWDWHESLEPLIKKHGVKPQIWRTAPSPKGETPDQMVQQAAKTLMPIIEKTKSLGLKFGLYNHGGWGGEPKNLVAVCKYLRREHNATHVGIVYNLHHAHGQTDAFAKNLERMRPYLLCINLNGMVTESELREDPSRKIMPLGMGEDDQSLLRVITQSGYDGPIGVLDHRNEMDAEESLRLNLDGLIKIISQLEEDIAH